MGLTPEQIAEVHERLGPGPLIVDVLVQRGHRIGHSAQTHLRWSFLAGLVLAAALMGLGLLVDQVVLYFSGLAVFPAALVHVLRNAVSTTKIVYNGDIQQVRWNGTLEDLLAPPATSPTTSEILDALAEARDAGATSSPADAVEDFLRRETLKGAGVGALSPQRGDQDGALTEARQAAQHARRQSP